MGNDDRQHSNSAPLPAQGATKGAATGKSDPHGGTVPPSGPLVHGVLAQRDPHAGLSDMERIEAQLEGIRTWGNTAAANMEHLHAAQDSIRLILEGVTGSVDALQRAVAALQQRLDAAPSAGPGGVDAARVRALEEQVQELRDRPQGPLSGPAQKAHLERTMKQTAAQHVGDQMLYHPTLPPRVVRNNAQRDAAQADGFKHTPLEAAEGDAAKAREIHERAARAA